MLSDSPIATTSALDQPIECSPVPSAQINLGRPLAGAHVLTTALDCEIGVWEMTAGSMTDVETDEIFVVVGGEGTVTLLVDGLPTERFPLKPGVVCRLTAGVTTLWEVPRRLRKVYVTATPPSP